MNLKQFRKLLDRDLECVHCGTNDATLIPQHRANRGMGGSHKKNNASNLIVMCSEFNWRIEADPYAARIAKNMGWKLENWQDAKTVPVWQNGKWFLLDDDFGKFELPFYDHID